MTEIKFSCQDLVELVTEYLEGTLSPQKRTDFETHLQTCAACQRYLEQMQITIRTLGRLSESDIPPLAQEELLHVFQDWKDTRNP